MSFTEDMYTAGGPPANLVKLDCDDVDKTAISFAWMTDRCFKVTYSEATLFPTDVDLKTLNTHPNFKTALGELVFPFDDQAYELDISGLATYIDPNLTISLVFQSDMDQTVTPLTSEMNIYANSVLKVPDTIYWQNPTNLRILYWAAGLGVGPFDIELPSETDRLRCLLGSVIPPFRLDGI